jgi:predicted nucleic acid-binding protein
VLYAAVLDTCVLYPPTLRDALLSLAEAGLYRPLWTEDILGELRAALVRRPGPGSPEERREQVDRLLLTMRGAFEDAMVTGHEPLVATMTNDPKDRHVLAAGVRGSAAAIVTFNISDFPVSATKPLEIETVHPDEFLLNQFDLDPDQVLAVMNGQVSRNRRPPRSIEQLAETLARSGLPQFAAELLSLNSSS